MAGRKLAAAVPEVQTRATGVPEALPSPNAKNAAERSSTCTHPLIAACSARQRASGVEREPGQMQACRTPARTSASTRAPAYAKARAPAYAKARAPAYA